MSDNDVAVGGNVTQGLVNTSGGDFVGRDKSVFLGRDAPTKQVINIAGDIGGDVVVYPNNTQGRIGTQIERLRGRISRLIPAEKLINELASGSSDNGVG